MSDSLPQQEVDRQINEAAVLATTKKSKSSSKHVNSSDTTDIPLLPRLPCDPLHHAAHPHTAECYSLDCLRDHCLHLETTRYTDDIVCTPTSPFSGSPDSIRSGTSPGYANDWADRQERLVIHANEPTKERIYTTVKPLAKASLHEPSSMATTDSSSSSSSTAAASSSSSSVSSSSSSAIDIPKSNASSSVVINVLPGGLSGTSKLLQRRQQRMKES